MDMKDAYISIVGNVKCKEQHDNKYKFISCNTGTIGLINNDAKMLLDLCNGKNRIRDIITTVSNEYEVQECEVESNVMNTLRHLKLLKLVDTSFGEMDSGFNYIQYMYDEEHIYDHLFIENLEIDYDIYEKFIQNYMNYGLFSATIRITKDVDEKLKNIITLLLNNHVLINLVWKGSVIGDDFLNIIKHRNLSGSFIFEILGSNKDIHNSITDIDFDTTILNINKIKDIGVNIDVVSLVNEKNIQDVSKIINLTSVLRCRAIYFQSVEESYLEQYETIKEATLQELADTYRYIPEIYTGMWGGGKSIEKLIKTEELIR